VPPPAQNRQPPFPSGSQQKGLEDGQPSSEGACTAISLSAIGDDMVPLSACADGDSWVYANIPIVANAHIQISFFITFSW
jgi:hypothetical protein